MPNELSEYLLEVINEGTKSFKSILSALPGFYPTDVMKAIHNLNDIGKISPSLLESISSFINSQQKYVIPNEQVQLTPPPHLLDYEWRFSKKALETILNIIREKRASSHLNISLLGIPSLYSYCIEHDPTNEYTLINIGNAGINYLKKCFPEGNVFACDLLSEQVPELTSEVIVMDPPWYPEYMEAFFWAASFISKKGANILLSMPPEGTRPSINNEIRDLIKYASILGFQLVDFRKAILPYVSPPFEWSALKAQGINNYPLNWRKGDLAIFKRVLENIAEKPKHLNNKNSWSEIVIQNVPLRIKKKAISDCFIDPSLKSITADNILPSVSRRFTLRESVDLWTPCNRVFKCENNYFLEIIISSISNGQNLMTTISNNIGRELTFEEIQKVIGVRQDLINLIALEKKDLLIHYSLTRELE